MLLRWIFRTTHYDLCLPNVHAKHFCVIRSWLWSTLSAGFGSVNDDETRSESLEAIAFPGKFLLIKLIANSISSGECVFSLYPAANCAANWWLWILNQKLRTSFKSMQWELKESCVKPDSGWNVYTYVVYFPCKNCNNFEEKKMEYWNKNNQWILCNEFGSLFFGLLMNI